MRAKHISIYTSPKPTAPVYLGLLGSPTQKCLCLHRQSQLAKCFKFQISVGEQLREYILQGTDSGQHVLFSPSDCALSQLLKPEDWGGVVNLQYISRQTLRSGLDLPLRFVLFSAECLTSLGLRFLAYKPGTRPGKFPHLCQMVISVLAMLLVWGLSIRALHWLGVVLWG